MKKIIRLMLFFSLFFFLSLGIAFASKSSVSLTAPESVPKGTEVTISVNVTHSGNNMFHYTNWVYIKVNGKEIARWDFTMTNTPGSENFTREIKYTVNESVQIEAEANCNIHGSAGIAKAGISVK
ncbi:MAG: class II SORL domain-containing protein [Proteobacteria bacterium]|nr:class II SORL domain-containing protein [Pseudomonadota bacterium]MBU1712807.1 class II SORL domain-containing protein [Pseudomonadota bacterium]